MSLPANSTTVADVPSSALPEAQAATPAPRSAKSLIWLLVRILATAGILYWVARSQEWEELRGAFASLEWWAWLGALFLYLGAQTMSAVRWHALSCAMGLKAPFRSFLRLYFLGMFFNLFLPTSIGGDVVRSIGLGNRVQGRQGTAAVSVILERAIGLVALLALGAIGYLFHPLDVVSGWVVLAIAVGTALAIAIWPMLPWLMPRLRHWKLFRRPSLRHESKRPKVFRMRRKMAYMAEALNEEIPHAQERGRLWTLALVLSFPVQILTVLMVVVLGESIGVETSLAFYAVAFSAVTLVTLLPITIAGVGLREGTFVELFASAGLSSEAGMALGLLVFSVQAASSLFGMISFIAGGRKEAVPVQAEPAPTSKA